MAGVEPAAWPESLYAAPVLRGLDAAGRRAIEDAGKRRSVRAGQAIHAVGDLADSFFVVERGEVELHASGRGLDSGEARLVRVVRVGETFGEEATLAHARRLYAATARGDAQVAEIPAALFRRALGRSGRDERDGPEHRLLRRRFTADLLRNIAFVRTLSEADFDLLLDAAIEHEVERGDRVFSAGDPPDGLWLIAQGLVQLQRETDEGKIQVSAYLSDGDLFGDAELLDSRPRTLTAVAMGSCRLLRISPSGFRQLVDRNPDLLANLRRVTAQRASHQAAVVEQAPHSTRHVFADLYRMQMARSLLTIDQDTCVRCGHCAWSCEQLHGVARLVRRGDKVVTRLRVLESPKPGHIHDLLLPNSCQHCQNPACMIDCPTGAIGRDASGEVFIREALCTGCGNCAKACPWENIRMAPRKLASGAAIADQFAPALVAAADRKHMKLEQMFPAVATKCDLCRDYEAPACVQSCPTESLIRLEPQRDFTEVAALLGASGKARRSRVRLGPWLMAGAAAIGLAGAIAGAGLHHAGALQAGFGWGLAAGWIAAASMVGLVAHALPKRAVNLWMHKRQHSHRDRLLDTPDDKPLPRSRVRPFYLLHIGLGLLLPGLLLAHAGSGRGADPAAASLLILAWATLAFGLFGAAAHALLPRRLAALERRGALPEDLVFEREHLLDRLQRELSGRSSLVKRMTSDFLLPWARRPLGGVALLLLGGELGDQQARLRARIDAALPEDLRSQPQALTGMDDCIRIVVELRALPARRLANAMLRGWLMPHVLLTGALLVALIVHVLIVTVFSAI
jgi:CRP-like cAMP-binding protein/Fe-S-cluster-containing dehydrogenase component